DHFTQRHPENLRKMLELGRAESVNINVRVFLANMMKQRDVPIELQFRVMPTLHQNLHAAGGGKLVQFAIQLFERDDVMISIFFRAVKRAELAVNVADI